MRRFITSLAGKVISAWVVLALLLPSITLILASKASAQVAVQPTIAVVEFHNVKAPGTGFGKAAADAVTSEFTKTQAYDVLPTEIVDKAVSTLGIASPPDGKVNLFRIAQEVRTQYIVSGEVSDYRIVSEGTTRHAVVALSVVVYDVASETALNGASVSAESVSRPNSVDEATLVNDAVTTGSQLAVQQIHDHSLPSATVLNTQVQTALINQGSRSGFVEGQNVIVTRGRQQVATATIADVEPDSSTIQLQRTFLGIQPGDKVHVVFELPAIVTIDRLGGSHTPKQRRPVSSNASIISALLVVGLVVALLSNGNSNATGAAASVTAEAELQPGQLPQVRVSWAPTAFDKGNAVRSQWQIWRSDVSVGPVLIQQGSETSIDDGTVPQGITGSTAATTGTTSTTTTTATTATTTGTTATTTTTAGLFGAYTAAGSGTECLPPTAITFAPTPIQIGRPYTYQVELLFALSQNDLPTGSTTSGGTTSGTTTTGGTSAGGTTGGTTGGLTTGGTTGGTTGSTTGSTTGTTTTGTTATSTTSGNTGTNNDCFFISGKTSSQYATPINAAILQIAQPKLGSLNYDFGSVVTNWGLTVQYELEFSDQPFVTPGYVNVWKAGTAISNAGPGSTLFISANAFPAAAGTSNAPTWVQNATSLYWRVGAKNLIDRPGPLPDVYTNERYVFSQPQLIQKPVSTVPGAPVNVRTKKSTRPKG